MGDSKFPPTIAAVRAGWPGCRFVAELARQSWPPGWHEFVIEHETEGLQIASYTYSLREDDSDWNTNAPLEWRPAEKVVTTDYRAKPKPPPTIEEFALQEAERVERDRRAAAEHQARIDAEHAEFMATLAIQIEMEEIWAK